VIEMLGNFMVAKVALSSTSYNYDIEYSYSVSKELEDKIKAGMRVLVPFGRGNRKRIGFVTRTYFKDYFDPALKPILNVIDDSPCVNDEMMKIILWLKENTFCTYFEALSTVIPRGLGINFNLKYSLTGKIPDQSLTDDEAIILGKLQNASTSKEFDQIIEKIIDSENRKYLSSLTEKGFLTENNEFKRNVGDETVRMVRLTDKYLTENFPVKLSQKQNQIIEMLEECECASIKEICYLCNVTSSVIKALVKKDVLTVYDYVVLRTPITQEFEAQSPKDIILSEEQNMAFEGIKELIDSNKPAGALLHGVTGSGKTSVFVKLIDYTLKINKTVILLVPEISLTPQMVAKFKSLFGNSIAVMHSNLSLGQRVDEYKRIKSGDAKIVIGTRSAVFAPLENIGLIIMDEEGERTYKSESSPRYHARDVAIQRCGYHNAILLLASATPSIESYYYAQTGRYKLFELKERYSKSELPNVVIVDMQLEAQNGNNSIFSNELIRKINENLEKKEQTILLLNRRGYHTYISCLDCREPLACPYCNIPLTYHKANGQLMCHYCGYSRPLEEKCEKCGSTHLRPTGAGTQKLEDEIERLFPTARVLRMDADTTYSRYSYEKNFTDFGDGKYDIMVGTQMIAKGLDFPNVTLVGVLSLDKALFTGDFRSYERTFSLITQVVGRSGRGEKKGIAFIQTYVPEHYVLNLAAEQDYKGFYEEEIALRKVLTYPPFCDICVIGLSSIVESEVAKASQEVINIIKQEISEQNLKIPLRVLGPSKCTLGKINNKFRYRVIIKCRNSSQFRKLISEVLIKASKNKLFSNTSIYADINGDIGL
jgi:primosomal protein N' (replication factor Y)